MQVHIDQLTEELNQSRREISELDKVKEGCYHKIKIIQTKSKSDEDQSDKSTEAEKQRLKKNIAEALAEISDVSMYS